MTRLKARQPRFRILEPRLKVQPHQGPERDRMRMASAPWRKWYKTARWRALRLDTFTRDRFTCQMKGCGRIEGRTALLVCDHVRPHRGDERLFWDCGNLQTLCKDCHDRVKQAEEAAVHRAW